MSSWFFRRLGDKLQKDAISLHEMHHTGIHTSSDWGYPLLKLKFGRRPPRRRVPAKDNFLVCGEGCSKGSPISQNTVVLDRSDINFKPLAQIRDGDKIFEIKMTVGRKAFCTCSPGIDLGILCKHMEQLIAGQQKGLLTLEDGSPLPSFSRKLLLE